MVKAKTTTVYETGDGEVFTDKTIAEKHEATLENLKYFVVMEGNDLTEGRYHLKNRHVLAVNAKSGHHLFSEFACNLIFGPPVEFVMGCFGSNAILRRWVCESVKTGKTPEKIDYLVEEEFVDNIIGEGVHVNTSNGWRKVK